MMEDGRVGVGVDRRCVVVNGRSEDVVLTVRPSWLRLHHGLYSHLGEDRAGRWV